MDIHYCFLKMQVLLGGSNPLVIFFTRRLCRRSGVDVDLRKGALELSKDNRVMRIPTKHFGYASSLAARFDLFFSLVVPFSRGRSFVVDYSVPKLQTLALSGLQFEMASFPEEEGAAAAYFRRYTPRQGDVIFDLGAHCGVSTYHFSKAVGPSGKVIAFEPDKLNHSLLLKNVERYKLSNVTVIRAAIGGANGRAAFNSEGTQGSGLSRHFGRPSFCRTEMVDVMTLEHAFDQWGIPDFCKIDIEGAEIETLAAARERLAHERIPLALDTSHVVDGTRTQFGVERILKASGYITESLEIDGFMNTWAIPMDSSSTHPE